MWFEIPHISIGGEAQIFQGSTANNVTTIFPYPERLYIIK